MTTTDFAEELCRVYEGSHRLVDEDIILSIFKMVEETPTLFSEYEAIRAGRYPAYGLNTTIGRTICRYFNKKGGQNQQI